MVYTLVSSSESSEAAATRWVEAVEEAAYRKSSIHIELLTNAHENEWTPNQKTTE